MFASNYLDSDHLYSIEEVLFHQDARRRYRYFLLDRHNKQYYVGYTSNAACLINKLRTVVLKAEYKVLAHHLQSHASHTQMSDWIIGVVKDNVTVEEIVDVMNSYGFNQIHKAKQFELSPRENSQCYIGYNALRDIKVAFTTAQEDADDTVLARLSYRKAQALCEQMKKIVNPSEQELKVIKRLNSAGYHSAQNEWTCSMAPIAPGFKESQEYAREFNKNVIKELVNGN